MQLRAASNLTGLALSAACVVHCMALPLFLSSLAAWGVGWLASPGVHQTLAVLGVGIGLGTLLPDWRRHGRHIVPLFAVVGLLIMNYEAFAGEPCCAELPEPAANCQDACCSAGGGASSADPPEASNRAAVGFLGWLSRHPTALGAALLCWAHILNGRCRCGCCDLPEADQETNSDEADLEPVPLRAGE